MTASGEAFPADNVLRAALWYRIQLGWSVIPVCRGTKKPPWTSPRRRFRWAKYQNKPPTENEIRGWWVKWPDADVAVVLGPVSGNLACRDFDRLEAWGAFKLEQPELAAILPVVRTGRGKHVYFTAVTGTSDFGDGELRGGGGYCVVPPSVHANSTVYTWERCPDGPIPELDRAIFARTFADVTEGAERTERIERTERGLGESPCNSPKVPRTLAEAIAMTLPKGPGERHHCLFAFCRALKALPQCAGADAVDLQDEFCQWFERAEPFIRTKDRMISWDEFCDGWERVEYPMGADPMLEILERARQRRPVEAVAAMGHERTTLLANICAELQERAGDKAFFLSTRKAGALIGVESMTAWRYLRNLERGKILTAVLRGTVGENGKATRWRFIGEPAGPN